MDAPPTHSRPRTRRLLGATVAALVLLGCTVAAAETPPPPKAAGKVRPVQAGPILDNDAAKARCPQVCKPPSTWKGGWRTTEIGLKSECDVRARDRHATRGARRWVHQARLRRGRRRPTPASGCAARATPSARPGSTRGS